MSLQIVKDLRPLGQITFADEYSSDDSPEVDLIREDIARLKLKKLLEVQTSKNESLNEKKIRLIAQQKSLIALLQKKDSAISELSVEFLKKKNNRLRGIVKIVEWVKFLTKKNKFRAFVLIYNNKLIASSPSYTQRSFIVKAVNRIFRRAIQDAFSHIKLLNASIKTEEIINESKESITKSSAFMKRFLSLTTLFEAIKKFNAMNLSYCFQTWKNLPPRGSPIPLLLCLNSILTSRLSGLFIRKPSTLLPSCLPRIFTRHKKLIFSLLVTNSFRSSFSTASTTLSSYKSSLVSLKQSLRAQEIQISEQSTDNKQLKSMSERLKAGISSLVSKSVETDKKNKELGETLSNYMNSLKRSQSEAESQEQLILVSIDKYQKEIEENNEKISELENSIEYYCNEITRLEHEGRLSTIQHNHLQVSIKKAQELVSIAISEKSRLQASEAEQKKQRMALVEKIDELAEEKQIILEALRNAQQEKKIIADDNEEKQQKLLRLQDTENENQKKNRILVEKQQSLSRNLEEESEIQASLLAHKQNELRKLKDSLTANRIHIESLIKDLNAKLKSEEQESTKQVAYDTFQSKQRLENLSNTFQISSSKPLQSQLHQISKERRRLSEELVSLKEATSDSLMNLNEYSRSLETQIQELTENLSDPPELSKFKQEKSYLEGKIVKLQTQLSECNEFVVRSRREVADAIAEIENYARILAVMEEKMNEGEEKLLGSMREKEAAADELRAIRQQYFNIISAGQVIK